MKNQSIIVISILAVGVGLALGYALWGDADTKYTFTKQTDTMNLPAGMHRMPDGSLMGNMLTESTMGMMDGMDHSMMMVKSEREFIEGMIPHHLEAVMTSKEVLARGGTTPEIKKLAENIVMAQEKEINMMKSWYQTWYGTPYTEVSNTYKPMMRELEGQSGVTLDRTFLEDMIMHHMGAIMMAESVAPYIEHDEIKELTKTIKTSQSKEIADMQEMLKGL